MNKGVPCSLLDQRISSFFPDQGFPDPFQYVCGLCILAHTIHVPHMQWSSQYKIRSNASPAWSPPTAAHCNKNKLQSPCHVLYAPCGLIPAYIPASPASPLFFTLCPSGLLSVSHIYQLHSIPGPLHLLVPFSRMLFSIPSLTMSSTQMSPESSLLQYLN